MAGAESGNEVYFPASDCFRAELIRRMDEEGHGGQARLAKGIGRGTKHLNDIVQGRRPASLDFQERVARFYRVPLDEMLSSGRRLLMEKSKPFRYTEEAEKIPDWEERADFICEKAIEDMGLLGENPILSRRIARVVIREVMQEPGDWDQYVRGAMENDALFVRTKDRLMAAIDDLSKRLPPKRKRKSP